MEGIINSFVRELKKGIKEKFRGIFLVCLVGSRVKGDYVSGSDLDVLVILNEDKSFDHAFYFNFLDAVTILRSKYGRDLAIFSTITLEEHSEYLWIKKFQKEPALIHFLIYPCVDDFLKWEPPTLIKGMLASAVILHGKKNAPLQILSKVPAYVPFKEVHSFLLKELIKAHVYVEFADVPEDLLRAYGFLMLKYCVRYLSVAVLSEFGLKDDNLATWSKVLQCSKRYDFSIKILLEELDEIDSGKKCAPLKYVKKLYRDALILFEEYSSVENVISSLKDY